MMRLKKNTEKMLLGIILAFLGMVLSGCAYSEIVTKDLLNIPMVQTKNINNVRVIVYGISFEMLDTVIRIKKFGIHHLNKNTTEVRHGLSYALEYNEVSSATAMELKMILKRYHFDSQKQFRLEYSSAEPILPNSDFKAIPKEIGQELFFLAQKTNLDNNEPLVWPLLN